MSYNPARGCGAGFAKAHANADRYRKLYHETDMVPFKNLYRKSKYLYYWYRNQEYGSSTKRPVTDYLNGRPLQKFLEFKDRLFPKLIELLPD